MTTVFDLRTYNEYIYDLPPEEAVKAAYRQYELKDFNWWMPNDKTPEVKRHGNSVSCGDFTAVIKDHRSKE